MMKGQSHERAAWTGEGVGAEREEVTIGFDEEIDNLLLGRSLLAAASQERQRNGHGSEKQPSPRQARTGKQVRTHA
jgi:hypothetical protein